MEAMLLKNLHHRIIVSVQADPGEPLNKPDCILALAQSAINGGAAGLRLANPENITYVKEHLPHIPVIGITKPPHPYPDPENHVYITPNLWATESIAQSGAEIVAMDATQRERPGGETLAEIVKTMKTRFPETYLMADIATQAEALSAEALGFDMISTTLSGYTAETKNESTKDTPDFALLKRLVSTCHCPIILEGRVWTPEDVTQAFDLGAYAVVIGSAITRPQLITRRFVKAIPTLKAC